MGTRRRTVGLAAALAVLGAIAVGLVIRRKGAEEVRPVVGLSLDATVFNRLGITRAPYDAVLAKVGARTLTLRPGETPVEEVLDRLDAILLTGGGDVDPALSGAPEAAAILVDRARDEYEIALVRAATARNLPVLGICRGLQLLNVAHGGTVRTIRDDAVLNATHGIDLDSFAAHPVELAAGSLVARLAGTKRRKVSSFHGQAVDRVGAGLKVVARAPDGIIEAVERPDRRFVVGVQWHPEMDWVTDGSVLDLFHAFVAAARQPASASEAERPSRSKSAEQP